MTESPGNFAQFLLWERSSRDTLEVKRLYIDMAGDLVAGVVLSQVVYWHLPNREGRAKLQVEREGKLWLAKGRDEWWEECRISPKQADRALEVLEGRGLIEVRLFKFGRAPRKHIRILHDEFLRAWKAEIARTADDEGPAGPAGSDFDQRSKSWISTKGKNRLSPKVKNQDFTERVKSLNTEITTETTAAKINLESGTPEDRAAAALIGSHTSYRAGRTAPQRHGKPVDAASEGVGQKKAQVGQKLAPQEADQVRDEAVTADAATLAEELVAHGVGRSAAERYARQKPEICRRCLDYLPYAKFKTTKGAWLANAIRDEYGPPPGYEEAKAHVAREREADERDLALKARQTHALAMREEKVARLGAAYRQLEEARGEALAAFIEYVEQEKAKTDRVAVYLSPERRAEILGAFDRPERRLELFEAWMNAAPGPLFQSTNSSRMSELPPKNGLERDRLERKTGTGASNETLLVLS